MQKLLLLLILSLFSTQGLAASCPDGSEPEKTVSADGSYYEYKCPVFPALPIPDYVDKETESPWNFFDDFEDQSFYRYIFSEPIYPDKGPGKEPYKLKKDPDGNTYLEITVKDKWNKCCQWKIFTERAEMSPREKNGIEKIIWYGFKVRLPKDFIHIDDRVLFHQFKNQFTDMRKSPLLGLRFHDRGDKLGIGGDTGGDALVSRNREESLKYTIELDYYATGTFKHKNKKWYPIKLKHKEIKKYGIITVDLMSGIEPFDATPLGEWTTYKVGIYSTKTDSGFVKVYKDDILIFDYEGVTFDWKGPYYETLVRIGPYRDSDPTKEGYPPQSIHYEDFTVVSDKKTLDKYLK